MSLEETQYLYFADNSLQPPFTFTDSNSSFVAIGAQNLVENPFYVHTSDKELDMSSEKGCTHVFSYLSEQDCKLQLGHTNGDGHIITSAKYVATDATCTIDVCFRLTNISSTKNRNKDTTKYWYLGKDHIN